MSRFVGFALSFLLGVLVGAVGLGLVLRPGHEAGDRGGDEASRSRGDTRGEAAPSSTSAPREPTLPDAASPSLEGMATSPEERAFLAKALAAERARVREAVIRPEDDGLDVLRRRLEHGADLTRLVADYDAFAAHVRAPEEEAFHVPLPADGAPVSKDDLPPAARLIEFGPGTYEVPRLVVPRDPLDPEAPVRAFEIRGAGMDRTTLVSTGAELLRVNGEVRNLVLRDFTWQGGTDTRTLLGLRGRTAVRVERVRMKAWRSGAAIGVGGPSYLALRECEFLGGHGIQFGGHTGVRLQDDAVVMAYRCFFADLDVGAFTGWKRNGPQAGVWVTQCEFENTRLSAHGGGDPNVLHATVRGGTAAYGLAAWSSQERRRRWARGIDADVKDLTLRPGLSRATPARMIEALRLVELTEGDRVLGIEVCAFDRSGPTAFRVFVMGKNPWDRRQYVVRPDAGTSERAVEEGEFPIGWSKALLKDALDIPSLLMRVEIPEGASLFRFVYGSYSPPDGSGAVPSVQVGLPWRHSVYDARDGALLEDRDYAK